MNGDSHRMLVGLNGNVDVVDPQSGWPIRSCARSARIVAFISGEGGQAGDVPADDQ
jgi:hypothetical protein